MKVQNGSSTHPDAHAAVAECTAGWSTLPDVILVFSSTRQDAAEVSHALTDAFPGVPVAGCTTSGEHRGG